MFSWGNLLDEGVGAAFPSNVVRNVEDVVGNGQVAAVDATGTFDGETSAEGVVGEGLVRDGEVAGVGGANHAVNGVGQAVLVDATEGELEGIGVRSVQGDGVVGVVYGVTGAGSHVEGTGKLGVDGGAAVITFVAGGAFACTFKTGTTIQAGYVFTGIVTTGEDHSSHKECAKEAKLNVFHNFFDNNFLTNK